MVPRTCLRYNVNSKVVFLGLHWFNYLFVCLIGVSDKHFNNNILYTVLSVDQKNIHMVIKTQTLYKLLKTMFRKKRVYCKVFSEK